MKTVASCLANAEYYGRTSDVMRRYWLNEAERIRRGEPYACTAHFQCRGGCVGCVVNGEILLPGCER